MAQNPAKAEKQITGWASVFFWDFNCYSTASLL
jgi:hypothetical protein